MDELFRFLMLRSANLPPSDQVKVLQPSFIPIGSAADAARMHAAAFAATSSFVRVFSGFAFWEIALEVTTAVRSRAFSVNTPANQSVGRQASVPPALANTLTDQIRASTGLVPTDVVAEPRFVAEETRLIDTLIAMKLLSNSSGGDAPALVHWFRAMMSYGRSPTAVIRSFCALWLTSFAAPLR